jgi:GR25 family glycosyltransferase involved in LPS biosynthesis
VNGQTVDIPDGFSEPVDRYNPHSKGQIGCYMAHRDVWREVAESKQPYVLILEDDCDLRPIKTVVDHINTALQQASKWTWDIFYVSRNIYLTKHRKQLGPNLQQVGKTWGLFAYALTPKAAKELYETSIPMRSPVDLFVSCTKKAAKLKLAVSPLPFLVVPTESDTI